jgi:deoxyribodipyrimidine photo-lyase
MKKYKKSIFIFRRDLRLDDNTGLIRALEESESVVPCFVFDPRQTEKNEYKSDNAIQFMIESLKDLDSQLKEQDGKLFLFRGKAEDIVGELIRSMQIDAVCLNRDYTPFSRERDSEINRICQKNGIKCLQYCDALINEPDDVLKKDGKPYTVFSAFYRNSQDRPVSTPLTNSYGNYYKDYVQFEERNMLRDFILEYNEYIHLKGGRKNGKKILGNLGVFKNYEVNRDIPSIDGTTNLSAHLKFGTCSTREVYHSIKNQLGSEHPLIRQLYWRDFFTHIGFHYPHVFGESFKHKFRKIKWSHDKKLFNLWCQGKTGFPIVDAGMRQLNQTGFMHNRVRMITASFLTKDLHIDWRSGEKYFAQKLVDYDPAVNNGNWQWVASTGCDAQPYFRIFNPWLQQKKFDPESKYIKKWVPELESVHSRIINNLFKEKSTKIMNYPSPILDHAKESKYAKFMYKEI